MEFTPPSLSPWSTHLGAHANELQKWWLTKPNALTAGLRTLGKLELKVLAEYSSTADETENWMLNESIHLTSLWVREIVMSLDGMPVVAARSLCKLSASQHEWAAMRGLSNRPLADLLYSDPNIRRSNFCFIDARDNVHLSQLCQTAFDIQEVPLNSYQTRASKFTRKGKSLIVMESFAPEFWSNFARILPPTLV